MMFHGYTNLFGTSLQYLVITNALCIVRLLTSCAQVNIEKQFFITNSCSRRTFAEIRTNEVTLRRTKTVIIQLTVSPCLSIVLSGQRTALSSPFPWRSLENGPFFCFWNTWHRSHVVYRSIHKHTFEKSGATETQYTRSVATYRKSVLSFFAHEATKLSPIGLQT